MAAPLVIVERDSLEKDVMAFEDTTPEFDAMNDEDVADDKSDEDSGDEMREKEVIDRIGVQLSIEEEENFESMSD